MDINRDCERIHAKPSKVSLNDQTIHCVSTETEKQTEALTLRLTAGNGESFQKAARSNTRDDDTV